MAVATVHTASQALVSADRPPAPMARQMSASELIQRQVAGIDAWTAAHRERVTALTCTPRSRESLCSRDLDVLARTQQALVERTARGLEADPVPMLTTSHTAVVAHRHGFYAGTLARCLEQMGVHVLHCSDHAPDALAAVIAEQPSALFVSDQLVMMTGRDLLREASTFAPHTVLAAQTSAGRELELFEAGANVVFPGARPAPDLADWLRCLLGGAQPGPQRTGRRPGAQRSGVSVPAPVEPE